MKTVAIFTENFFGRWKPQDLEKFLGGCQECVVLLSQALVRAGYTVDVFLVGPIPTTSEVYNGVNFRDFSEYREEEKYDSAILFKINPFSVHSKIFQQTSVIFWSSDVQKNYIPGVKKYVCLTEYHKNRNDWKNDLSQTYVIPHGVDFVSINGNKAEKEPHTVLYCSSPDRGLFTLLEDWDKIKKHFPRLKLYITYGFKIARQFVPKIGHVNMNNMEEKLKQACVNTDIYYLGDVDRNEIEKLYWKCQYWILPLNRPDSELFCISAIKAHYCGCIPIVNKIGALTETVGRYIDYSEFTQGKMEIIENENIPPSYSWGEVVEKYWKEII